MKGMRRLWRWREIYKIIGYYCATVGVYERYVRIPEPSLRQSGRRCEYDKEYVTSRDSSIAGTIRYGLIMG